MANQTCLQRLRVCHLRIVRLGGDGSPLDGADSLYESAAPIQFTYTPQSRDRDQFELANGCGENCASFIGPPGGVDNAEIGLQLCNNDAEIMELLAGGEIITDYEGTGDTIGYCSPTNDTVNQLGVAIEMWAQAWNGTERAVYQGQPAWWRYVFPKVNFTFPEQTFENEFGILELEGFAETNSGYGTGIDSDPFPFPIGGSVWCQVLTDSVPDAECGYQPLPAAA